MVWAATAVAGATLVSGYMASSAASDAAEDASDAQVASTRMSINEQRRQFDELQQLLSPYSMAATGGGANASPTQQIADFYTKYLGRQPDSEHLKFWTSELNNGTRSLDDIEREISTGFEARQYILSGKAAEAAKNAPRGSLQMQQDLLGINGAGFQQSAISGIENSPQFTALMQQGENAILQNASATGGLRGGNTQGALAQFRPALLNQLINEQYAKLGGITSLGQNSAVGAGNAGMQSASAISGLLQQQGAAQAGNALAQGQATGQMWNSVSSGIGTIAGGLNGNNFSNLFGSGNGIAGAGGAQTATQAAAGADINSAGMGGF